MRAVFVCGTGRSGTTVMRRALGMHPQVVTLPGELRLICDAGGLLDLHDALFRNWDPYSSDQAVERFFDLARALTSQDRERYSVGRGHHMDGWVPNYFSILSRLRYSLGVQRIPGRWTGMSQRQGHMNEIGPGPYPRVLREFVENLYLAREEDSNPDPPTHWVDDTPYLGLHAERLAEVFPDRRFVFCVRHPLDLLHSFISQEKRWTPNDARLAAVRIRNLLDLSEARVHGLRTITVRLEDVMRDRAGWALHVFSFLGLGPGYEEEFASVYDPDLANIGRRTGLPDEDVQVGVDVLGDTCERFGYEVDV